MTFRFRVPTRVLVALAVCAATALVVALALHAVGGAPHRGLLALTGLAAALAWIAFLGHLRDGPADDEEDHA